MNIKKTVVHINSVNYGSTGNIMCGIAKESESFGFDSFVCCADSRSNRRFDKRNQIFIGNPIERYIHLKLSRFSGFQGCFSRIGTWRFLKELDKMKTDVIHLHNLHNCYINLPMLFRWIKKRNIQTVWTLHDCWAFTGHCPHFVMAGCDRWKNGCHDCSRFREYPSSRVDDSKLMYSLKKKWFTGVKNMTIVTPSRWLGDMVKQSYLKDYPVKVINNGIDLDVFKPMESDFRNRYDIGEKHIVLGVAFGWGKRKGLDVFIELSKRLGNDYKIVLVGIDDDVDKLLPDNIISIHRSHNQQELAEIYSAADVFANPTREDNFPTVNMESLACGTPVITFETGGSPEIIDETCGIVVPCDDIDAFERKIKDVCENKLFSEGACINRAKQFDMNDKFREYVEF